MPAMYRSLVLVAPLLVCALGCSSRKLTTLQSQAQVLTEQNKNLTAQVEDLKSSLDESVEERTKLETELAQLFDETERDRRLLEKLQSGGGPQRVVAASHLRYLSEDYPDLLTYDPETACCRFKGHILFDSGRDDLRPQSKQVIEQLAAFLKNKDARNLRVMVVGHTDDQAITRRPDRERWPTNYHLATSRAHAVAEYLSRSGLDRQRIAVLGLGDTQPLSDEDTAEARSRNRRVEIFVVPSEMTVAGWPKYQLR